MIKENMDWQNARQNIKIIVFDMDGTIYSSESILHKAYKHAIAQYNDDTQANIPTPNLQTILAQVGQPAPKIFASLFPQLSLEQRNHLNEYSLQNLCDMILQGGGMIYPGIEKTLNKLLQKQYPLFIASNGRRPYIESILKGFDLAKFFGKLITIEDPGIASKAEIIQHYIKENSLQPKQCIMVGDRTADLEAARKAQSFFCGVTWGHGPVHEVSSADIIIEKTGELAEIFQ